MREPKFSGIGLGNCSVALGYLSCLQLKEVRDVEDDEETQYGEDCNEPTFDRNISKKMK